MSLLQEFTTAADFPAALAMLSRRWPSVACWLALDQQGGGAHLDIAPWRARGFDLRPAAAVSADSFRDAGGVLLVARHSDDIAPAVVDLVDAGWRDDVPLVTALVPRDGTPALMVNGVVTPIAAAEPLRIAPVTLRVRGGRTIRVVSTLPARLEIQSSHAAAIFECQLGDAAESARFRLASDGRAPIGRCDVTIDAPGATLTPSVMELRPSVPLRVERLDARLPRTIGGVRLHLVVDRSTVDAESWGTACNLAVGWEVDNPGALNASWRAQLAAGIERQFLQAYPDSSLCLYWFADRPRSDGIAAPARGVPVSDVAAGRVGEVSANHVARTLAGAAFEYLPGLDLYDAVDEALAIVETAIGRTAGDGRDLVVIVGDSPPPPADERDPIWRIVTDEGGRGVRSNARRSPLFTESLARLRERQVPVGWLFLREMCDPPDEHALHRTQHVQFRALRERVLEALTGFDGLLVHACDDPARLGDALTGLVVQLLDVPDGLPWARVRVSPAAEWA